MRGNGNALAVNVVLGITAAVKLLQTTNHADETYKNKI